MAKNQHSATPGQDDQGTSRRRNAPRGQALVEYILIVVLVVFAIVAILALTGPAVGNVFSNTVYNLLNQTTTPRPTLSETEFWDYVTAVASYTPGPIVVNTNTPPVRDDMPPVARTDNYNLETAVSTTLTINAPGVLFNDSDPNTPQRLPLTVINYTQPTCPVAGECGSVVMDLVSGDGSFVYTAGSFSGGFVSFTYTIENTIGLTAVGQVNIGVDVTGDPPETMMPTAQPSTTPVDLAHNYPFYDGGDSADSQRVWHTGFTNVLHGPWRVEYFNNLTFSGLPVTETRFWRPGVETLNMNWTMGSPLLPAGIGPDNFSVRFVGLSQFMLDYRLYEVHLSADGAAEVLINGAPVITFGAGGGSTTVRYTPPPPAGGQVQTPVTIEVRYQHTSGPARLRFALNNIVDEGQCNWRLTAGVYRSEFNAWQDSPGNTDYAVNSACYLRLRGYIDIPASAGEAPYMYFWERWALSATAYMEVGIREYDATSDWQWARVHGPTAGMNLNWRRQEFDLTRFGPGNVDFRGRRIEFAFRLVNPSDTFRADGWYIDDISVQDGTPNVFNVGFRDDIESLISNQLWINECNWRRTTSDRHSGLYSWTDSPSGRYNNNDDCSLTLNGLFDLTTLPAGGVEEPEITFWTKWQLTTTTDKITVEWRPENSTNPNDWAPLTPTGSADPWVARASSNPSWTKVFVNLGTQPGGLDLRGQRIQFRFRLQADDDQTAEGWWLDDIELRVRPVELVGVPFYEPFDTGDRWLFGGSWGLTQTTPPATSPVHYSPPTALTDSPGGDYVAGSNTMATLMPAVDLNGTTRPVLTFWTYWKTAQARLYLDVSTDRGATWQATPLWENTGTEYVQLAWQRIKIDLTSYRNDAISLRFRLQDAGSQAAEGWYIDDLRIEEDDLTTITLSSGEILEEMEGSDADTRWYNGGTWSLTADGGRLDFTNLPAGQPGVPSQGWQDSPGGEYLKPARSILEYTRRINLSGTARPTLYFFTTYELGDTQDRLYVDVSTDNGFTWSPTPLWENPGRVNLGWHRVMVDLSSFTGTPIRLRFRLESMNGGLAGAGWQIDDFRLYDRALLPNLGSNFDDNFNDLSRWVVEGEWVSAPSTATPSALYGGWVYQPPSLTPVTFSHSPGGSYPTITTSNWVGDYWHVPVTDNSVWTGDSPTFPTTPPNIGNDTSVGEVDFDYAADLVNRPFNALVTDWFVGAGTANHEYYLMRWERRFRANTTATFRMRLTFSGGARLYIKPSTGAWGAPLAPSTTLGRPFQTAAVRDYPTDPWRADPDTGSYYYEYAMSAGQTYDIRIEYYHTHNDAMRPVRSGPGRVEFRMAEPSRVLRTAPGAVSTDTYPRLHRTSLTLNGNVLIPAGRMGVVGFQERWSFTDTDYGRFFYSLNDGDTWVQLLEHGPNNPQGGGWSPGSTQDWRDASFTITGTNPDGTFAANTRVTFRFELNSLGNVGNMDEGWLIDDFQFFVKEATINVPPTSASATISGTTSTSTTSSPFCVTPTVVDSPGDTSHTFTMVSDPRRGAAWVQGGQLCYRPPVDWTGTTSFAFRATDYGGESVVGTAQVTIEPYFYFGINVNGPQLNVGGRTYEAWAGRGAAVNNNAGSDPTLIASGTSGNLTTMLQTWMGWNNANNGLRVGIGSLSASDVGVYTVYVYVIEDAAATNRYDVFVGTNSTSDSNRGRLQNNVTTSGRGSWQKLGPYTVMLTSGDLANGHFSLFLRNISGGQAKVAAIELWRGGHTTDWTSADVGGSGVTPGSTSGGGSGLTIVGSGSDIWNNADQFRYAWFTETGNVEIVARVNWSGTPPDQWAKAGVMIRDSDAPGSRHAMMVITRDNGVALQWRNSTNGGSNNSNNSAISARPVWVRLTRVGDVLTGFYSTQAARPTDAEWIQQGQTTIALDSPYLIGLAVTSHNNSATATGVFENVEINQLP